MGACCRYNKTAGCHRYIFCPLISLEIPFKKIKAFFFQKNTLSSLNFGLVPNLLFAKKLNKCGKIFSLKNFIWYALYNKSAIFTDFLKSGVFKKILIFFQKSQLSYFFEKFYYFSRILRQIRYNLVIKILKVRTVIFLWTFGHFQLGIT